MLAKEEAPRGRDGIQRFLYPGGGGARGIGPVIASVVRDGGLSVFDSFGRNGQKGGTTEGRPRGRHARNGRAAEENL